MNVITFPLSSAYFIVLNSEPIEDEFSPLDGQDLLKTGTYNPGVRTGSTAASENTHRLFSMHKFKQQL